MQNEQLLWEGSPSQLKNINYYLVCILFIWLIFPIFYMIWIYLKTNKTKYIFTNERFIYSEGVFNKSTDQIELYRIKDIRLYESFFMRLFGLGNILIITSDKTYHHLNLNAIKEPEIVKDLLRQAVEEIREIKKVREIDYK
jgi:uncharacterized membrane protein YdbT with pleckstrin-like domain